MLGRTSGRRFRIAVVAVSVVAAVVGSVALAMRDSSEQTTRIGVTQTLRPSRHPGAVVATPDALWVVVGSDRLQRYDLSTGRWAPPLNLGGEISHLTRFGDRLIASVQHVSRAGQLASVNWRTGDVTSWPHWFKPPVDQVVVSDGELWALATRPARLLRLDTPTLAPTSAAPLSSGRAGGLAAGNGYLWVTLPDDGDVLRIDPKTHAVAKAHVGGLPLGIAVDAGSVWVADRDGGEVIRLDADSLQRAGVPIRVGTKPSRLLAAGGSLFVTDEEDGTIKRIDMRSGKRVGLPIRIAEPTSGSPAPSLARAGQSVWASSFASSTLERIDIPDAGGGRVTVRFTHLNDHGEGDGVVDCSRAGTGRFKASGAISDVGRAVVYRCFKGSVLKFRYVASSSKGTLTFAVKVDTKNAATPQHWRITSATKAYRGLRGEGIYRENPPHFTIQKMTGTVTRER